VVAGDYGVDVGREVDGKRVAVCGVTVCGVAAASAGLRLARRTRWTRRAFDTND